MLLQLRMGLLPEKYLAYISRASPTENFNTPNEHKNYWLENHTYCSCLTNLTSFIDKVIFEKKVQTLPAVWGTSMLIITFI